MLLKTEKKSVDDDERDLPIPTQLVSNGEYWPVPQTRHQRKIEELTLTMADERARKLGVSRRSFLRSAAGTATALMALNIANGCGDDDGGFTVDDCATRDPEAAREAFEADFFVVDVQTHHADLTGPIGMNPVLSDFYSAFRICYPGMDLDGCTPGDINELSQMNYIKEVLVDSETSIAMMSGLPAPNATLELIGNAGMAATRDLGNELGASQRMLTQAMLTPNLVDADTLTTVADMEYLVNELGIRALKTYTGAGHRGEDPATAIWGDTEPWWLDDEEIAYPMYEEALRLGIDIVNSHKGLRLGVFDREHIKPFDIPKAVLDWPQIRFAIYHSAGEFLDDLVAIKQDLDANPAFANNLWAELGAIFAGNVISGDIDQVGHLLGKLVAAFGPDRILWGTDSIWYGTPQWQIDALKTFRMPRRLMDEFGYPEITDDIKARIFGFNAADLYGLDADELRCTIADDPVAGMRAEFDRERFRSLKTYGPRTRRDFIQMNYSAKPSHV